MLSYIIFGRGARRDVGAKVPVRPTAIEAKEDLGGRPRASEAAAEVHM